jgi:hypothetical protein
MFWCKIKYLAFFVVVSEAKSCKRHMSCLLSVHTSSFNSLRQILIDSVCWLVVKVGVALLEWSFELVIRFAL